MNRTTTTGVWITGAGVVTPLGNSYATFAQNLLSGRSGPSVRRLFGEGSGAGQVVGAVDEIPIPTAWDPQRFLGLDRLEQLCLACAAQALEHTGLWDDRAAGRIGLVIGLGNEWLRIWELDGLAGGTRLEHPSLDTRSVVGLVSRELQLGGPALAVAAACASGNYALQIARRWIEAGWVDVCLAGGCELLTPISYAGFANLRALSQRVDAPQAASRPFDVDRDGFVMAEGGAVLVLESAASARRRRAQPLAEVAGFGASSDAFHLVVPSSDPKPVARAVRQALQDAGADAGELDYINAHATSTPVGDRSEAKALQLALGDAVERVAVSSTKSMTGHLLSAAAAAEAVACLVALEHQAVPPTINLDQPDPECRLHHVAGHARPQPVRLAASNSFGFGGSNTCMLFRKVA